MAYESEDATWAAYANAVVDVHVEEGWVVTLAPEGQLAGGKWSPPGGTAHIISAWNPGLTATAAENAAAHHQLVALLDMTPHRWVPAVGRSRAGDWEEESVAVLDLATDEAIVLGRRFGQDAIFSWDGISLSVMSCVQR